MATIRYGRSRIWYGWHPYRLLAQAAHAGLWRMTNLNKCTARRVVWGMTVHLYPCVQYAILLRDQSWFEFVAKFQSMICLACVNCVWQISVQSWTEAYDWQWHNQLQLNGQSRIIWSRFSHTRGWYQCRRLHSANRLRYTNLCRQRYTPQLPSCWRGGPGQRFPWRAQD